MLLLLMTIDKEECQTPKKDDNYHKISHATARTLTITTLSWRWNTWKTQWLEQLVGHFRTMWADDQLISPLLEKNPLNGAEWQEQPEFSQTSIQGAQIPYHKDM